MLTLGAGTCRGKVIRRHENHPLGTEATLTYNLGPVSWGINKVRRATSWMVLMAWAPFLMPQMMHQPHSYQPWRLCCTPRCCLCDV